jgi:fermentation-respiration switch protein FrsA (DUF1100 family)
MPKKPPPARNWWRGLRWLLAFSLVVLLAMTFLETWLVYPIPPIDRGDWHPAGLAFEDVSFTSQDGTRLHGWFVERPQAKRAILYCHGNGENVGMNADVVAQLSDSLDASVFIFDYRGYGHSEGTPSEDGCIADGLAAQRWLAQRIGKQPSDVVMMGRSLGSGVAVAAASQQGAHALVLVSAFPRLTDVAAYHYPWLPVQLMMMNRYDSITRIHDYLGPVFQCHGTTDWIVPIEVARALFDAAPTTNKRFVEFADRGHNDPEPAGFYRELAAFLDGVDQETGAAAENPNS